LNNSSLLINDFLSILSQDISNKEITKFGIKYEVKGILPSLNNKPSRIITVWIILNNENNPKFITAYPEG
jgi:hypothetical protein